MHNDTPMLISLLLVSIYAILGTTYFCVGSVRNLLKERNKLKSDLAIADEYIQDLENEKGEMASGYSGMATTLEGLQTQIDSITAWMEKQEAHTEEHCAQIQQLASIRVRFMVSNSMSEDYTGSDECNEEPYSASTSPTLTPLPEWLGHVEGLDAL